MGTIHSHKLETIEFGPANSFQPPTWAMADDELCALIDRLEEDGWKGRLQVLIQYREFAWSTLGKGKLLTRFRNKGCGEVVESVDSQSYPYRMSADPDECQIFGPRNPLLLE